MTALAAQHLTVEDLHGSPLALAHWQVDENRTVLHLVITATGHRLVSSAARYQQLIDDILDAAQLCVGARLQAVLPAHDDLFDQVRTRCSQIESRPFGGGYLVEGVVNGGGIAGAPGVPAARTRLITDPLARAGVDRGTPSALSHPDISS